METRRDDRIAQLLQALKRSDKLHLKEAANLLGVSEMTIRRDLNSEAPRRAAGRVYCAGAA
jgi:DeoR family deoxyribose operon repressor